MGRWRNSVYSWHLKCHAFQHEGSNPSRPTITIFMPIIFSGHKNGLQYHYHLRVRIAFSKSAHAGSNPASGTRVFIMKHIKDYTRQELQKIADSCSSRHDILLKMGYSASGGTSKVALKEALLKNNIDVSHFKITKSQYQLDEVLIENSRYSNRSKLKERLLKAGLLEYRCASCGNTGEWNGKPLTLQLEHKNGVSNDNRLENLCFLCPNCHSQTRTYAGRNKRKD